LAIAHLSGGHYVVLHELGETRVVIGGPASGLVTWTGAFLARCYTGSLLFDWPAASEAMGTTAPV
jgi:hypothetical protein